MSTLPELVEFEDVRQLPEVDRRIDAANDIGLLIMDKESMVVAVKPRDKEAMPFGVKVSYDLANDAYAHPYAYMFEAAFDKIRRQA